MANADLSTASAPAPTASNRLAGLLTTLRVLVTLQALAILAQAILAGLLLEGESRALHGMNAGVVHLVALLQLIVAILVWRPGRGPARFVLPSALLLVAGLVQSAAGGSDNRYLHIPLGALMLAGAVSLLMQVWSRPGSDSRRDRS